MSDSNIVRSLDWSKFPPNTPTEFKQQYTEQTSKVESQVSEINKNSNGLKELNYSFDEQKKKVDDELATQNRNIEQQNQQIKGLYQHQSVISESVKELNGRVLTVEDSVKTLQDEMLETVKKDQFATLTEGGIVLVSEKVDQLNTITLDSAPASYDQDDEQKNRDAIQAAINGIITSINDLIVKQQAAKQMEL